MREFLRHPKSAQKLLYAIAQTLIAGDRLTPERGGSAYAAQVTDAVLSYLAQ